MNPTITIPAKFVSQAEIVANVYSLNAYRTRADFNSQSRTKTRTPSDEKPMSESEFDLALEAAIQELARRPN